VGFAVRFVDDHITIWPADPAETPELAAALPLWQRMKQALTRGPLTLAALSSELTANVDTLDRTVRRKNGLFTRITGSDGVARIALVERRIA
jgi:hypothetical protein